MLRAVWTGPYQLEINDTSAPPLDGPASVRIRIVAAGVCGTDLHIWSGQVRFTDPPLTLGHEFMGVVEECGRAVRHVALGDRVKCDSVVGCGQCEYCRRGATQFCPSGWEYGITQNGGWTQWMVVPERNLHRLPDSIPDEVAAIMDVEVIGAMQKARVCSTDTVVIFGAGPAGLIGLQYAKLQGAAQCVVCDSKPHRLAFARQLGADVTIDIRTENVSEAVKDLTRGKGADLAFEAAGSASAVVQSLEVLRPQGRALLYGVIGEAVPSLMTDQIVLKDLTLLGAMTNRVGWDELIGLVEGGHLKLAELITHRYTLTEASEALRSMMREDHDGIKGVLMIDKS